MKRQWLVSLLMVPLLLAVGVLTFAMLLRTKPEAPQRDVERTALVVETVPLEPQRVVQVFDGFGTAQADRAARVTAQVAGEVLEIAPELQEGAAVDAGAVLVKLDPRDYQQQLAQTRAQVAAVQAELQRLDIAQQNVASLLAIAQREEQIAERDYERVLDLYERGQAPLRERDMVRSTLESARRGVRQLENEQALLPAQRAETQARLASAQAAAELAQLALERTTVRAPFAGRIETVEVEVGERVNVGEPLFALLDPDLIEITIELPAAARLQVQEGAPVDLRLGSDPRQRWDGRIARIAPRADERNRTFAVYIEVDNREQSEPLLPGMFVDAEIAGPTLEDVLLVPRAAIQRGEVFVHQGGTALRRPVEVERKIRDRAVVSGLEPGDELIISNLDMLFDGAPVAPHSGASPPVAQPDTPGTDASAPVAQPASSTDSAQAQPRVRGS